MLLFGHEVLENPAPGSSVWVDFYVCDECLEDDPEKYMVAGLYVPDAYD